MTDTRWLTEQEESAWRGYLATHTRLSARLHRQLQRDSGLSLTDFEVLVHLTDRSDQRIRVLELAEELQWEKSRLSHHLGRMQRRGLVTRESCTRDGRVSYVSLTPRGREAIENAAPQHVETVRALFLDLLTEEQIDTLREISERVRAHLEDEAP
ncbi:MarR family transcriptional regulator [Streptomyces sp. NPDC005438]|uniref:MarR family winged helix-turn-helix transcriptional regulator n=1 Tax=Streptomyces sp. NPDC005438 TaxID=3156880 RepID=UPI0033A4268B